MLQRAEIAVIGVDTGRVIEALDAIEDFDPVALKLNMHPRKTLGYAIPSDRLYVAIALTG